MTKNNKKDLKNSTYWGNVFNRLWKNKLAMVSFFILLALVLACIFVPVFSSTEMYTTSVADRNQPPSSEHLLGTDKLGRDLFTRLFYAGRISLGIALTVTFFQCIIGVCLGSIAGYFGGIIDTIIMRLSELFMCFPFLVICITIQAVFGNSISILIFTLTLLTWPSIARIVRGQILALRELEYMEACRALGISDFKQMFRHLFPNILAYVIVYGTLSMASVILTETSLSFLGLGVSPPTPTWGNLIQEARNLLVLQDRWWFWIPPGLCIFASVMCFNLLGDGLRDAIDPKLQK